MKMNKRLQEILNGIGMVIAAFAMMAVGIAIILLVNKAFHAIFKSG